MAILAFDGGIGIFHGTQGFELKATIFAAILVKGHGWFPPHQILVFIVDWVNAPNAGDKDLRRTRLSLCGASPKCLFNISLIA